MFRQIESSSGQLLNRV